MRLLIFDDDRFGPRVWRAVFVDDKRKRAWCWTARTKMTEAQARKQWRTHGRSVFALWDATRNRPLDSKGGIG